jgi:hypothetical protein
VSGKRSRRKGAAVADRLAEALRALTEATADESLFEGDAMWSGADDALEAYDDAIDQEAE